MLDFGFSEILLTSAIALVVLGPERLPKVARQVGNWMGRARAMARQLGEQLEREVSADELMKEQGRAKAPPANANRATLPTTTAAPPDTLPAAAPTAGSLHSDASSGAAPFDSTPQLDGTPQPPIATPYSTPLPAATTHAAPAAYATAPPPAAATAGASAAAGQPAHE